MAGLEHLNYTYDNNSNRTADEPVPDGPERDVHLRQAGSAGQLQQDRDGEELGVGCGGELDECCKHRQFLLTSDSSALIKEASLTMSFCDSDKSAPKHVMKSDSLK